MKDPFGLKLMTGLFFLLVMSRLAAAEIPAQTDDPQILGVLAVIDQNEVEAAQLAQQKNIDKAVLDFARMMEHDHAAHLEKTRALAHQLGLTMTGNALIDKLRTEGSQDMAALTALDADAFAQMYVADMIKGHSQALNWIDNQQAQNRQVKYFLTETRKTVAMHLERAQQIRERQIPGT